LAIFTSTRPQVCLLSRLVICAVIARSWPLSAKRVGMALDGDY
jgi:hypothetical protein